jgi:hypothetical protein
MFEDSGEKRFDLEDRTFAFAKRVRQFVKQLGRTIGNVEDARQLVRASGSVGANYIEANEALSKRTSFCASRFAAKKQRNRGIFFVSSMWTGTVPPNITP